MYPPPAPNVNPSVLQLSFAQRVFRPAGSGTQKIMSGLNSTLVSRRDGFILIRVRMRLMSRYFMRGIGARKWLIVLLLMSLAGRTLRDGTYGDRRKRDCRDSWLGRIMLKWYNSQ